MWLELARERACVREVQGLVWCACSRTHRARERGLARLKGVELTSVRYEYGGERKVGVSRRELAVCGTGGAHGVLERGEGSERAYWCGIVRVGSCVWGRTESGVSATGARTGVGSCVWDRACGIVRSRE